MVIQSHFRSFLVRREVARRLPYSMKGPFTSRVFPMYRRDAPCLEEATRAAADAMAAQGRSTSRTTARRRQASQRSDNVGAHIGIGGSSGRGEGAGGGLMMSERRVVSRRPTDSSISTVGESLMSQLPLEHVFLDERCDQDAHDVEQGKQAM